MIEHFILIVLPPPICFFGKIAIISRMANSQERDFMQLQPRDFAILQGLFESRIMTAAHIAALYFDGKREYTKKRLQKFKAGGFIGERRRNANEPSILFLTHKAFKLL